MEIKSLTGIRGFAALWVFFLHAMWGREGGYLETLASFGGAGVIVFFVLSGFILSLNYDGKAFTYGTFLQARIARVYPLHLVTLLATAAFAAWGYTELPPTDGAYTFLLNVMMVQSWGFTPFVSWNQPAWSISHEFFAYLLFPVFISPLMRLKAWQAVIVSLFLAYLCQGGFSVPFSWAQQLGFIGEIRQFSHGASLVQFFVMFVIGCMAFWWSKTFRPGPLTSDCLVFAGLGLLLHSTLVSELALPNHIVVLSSVLIIIGLRDNEGMGRALFGNPLAHFLGKISFALYLSAPMVEYMLKFYIYPLSLVTNLAVSLIVATLLHFLIETPAQRFVRSFRAKPKLIEGV